MNLGRGFPIPPANGVMQNRNVWIPSTPGRPDLQRSNTAQTGMLQIPIGGENWPQIPIGEENWQELIGVYTGVLQGSGNNPSHNSLASPSHKDHSIQYVAPVETHNMLQQNNNPAMAFGLHSMGQNGQNAANQKFDQMGIQDFSTIQKFVTYDHQNARSVCSSSLLDFVEVVATPRKVNSLADLVGMPHVTPLRNTNIGVESNNQVAYTSSFVGDELQQTHILHSNGDVGSCNLQEVTNSTHSNRNYNLNLPPRPEASESSRFLSPLPFGPVTPGLQKQSKTYQISQEPNSLIDGTSTQEKHAQNTVFLSSPLPEIRIRDHSEILLGTPSESVAANGNGGIDLNQTPQQKPPRRKKHRPKVIREGKLKQTPKPNAEAKGQTPDNNSKVKRKYVRKNDVNASETPVGNEVNAVEPPNGRPGPAKKSKIRKRKLNFDSENGVKRESHDKGLNYQAQNNEGGYKIPFNLNLDAQNSDWSTNLTEPSTSTGNNHIYVHSNNKVTPQDSLAMVNMSPQRNHPLNVIARNINIQNSSTNQSTQEHHGINCGLETRVIHSNSSLLNSYSTTRQSTVQNMHPQLVDVTEIQGAEMRHPHAITLIGSQLWSKEVSDTGHHNRDSSGLWRNGLDMCGKTNVDYKFHGTSSSCTPSGVTTDDDFSGQIGWSKNFQSAEWENSNIRGHDISRNPNDKSNKFTHHWCMNYPALRPELHQQHALSQVHLCSEQVAQPKAYNSFNVVTNWNLGSASQRDPKSIPINGIINSSDRVEVNRRTMIDKRLELEAKSRRNYRNSAKKGSGLQEEKMISVDYITNLLKGLHIWTNKWQSSLVPYKGSDAVVSYTGDGAVVSYKTDGAVVPYKGDGAVVPYKEFDSVKRHRPRPRVDLDPETNRLWNLLMGKEGSESAETMDNNKQKWWEEERKVFRGRVDSFIARMHLIQGDRRFSKWKGSVVDSVIGVYLTQNVSDHLSSSAFMSLAAKFPLKPSTACQPCSKTGGSPSVEHHEVCITYPDGTTYQQKILREPASNHSTVTSTKSSQYKTNNVMMEKNTVLGNNHTNKTEEDIISSQSSSESFVFACEDIRSSSGSNSEGDDVWNIKNLGYIGEQAEGIMGNSHSYQGLLFGHQQSENQGVAAPVSSTVYSDPVVAQVPHNQHPVLQSPNYLPDMSLGLEKWEEDVLAFSANECISALASEEFEVTDGTGITPTHHYIGQNSESTFASINGIPKFQPSEMNHEILNKHPEVKTNSRDKSVNRIGQENFQQESDPTRPIEAFSKPPSGTTHEPAKVGPVNSSEKQANNIGSTTPNPRKRKAEKEKLEQFDWDILRKQVQSKCGTRERCGENMDSLDYETLRNADVREISDAIKERGMNNMLAERMKSFLNRVVQDHERIDLEWLRDVDPDKAKDYLLSIRGLGLKSVECVRLLTLHHMAFPVDTNVGRIAVRLGWVPLQPLPESLQLHLLELYPVLETIQKYIWPRLCKLDQETLYELHYQMITFGKVFCTKRDPNCNGCPMRGECRHFASAFASARLALPGPEEKRIVTSAAAPVTPNNRPDVIIKPMLLNSSEGNIDVGILGSTRNCEPLIEEPLSPEPHIEVSERDLEDAFYEDPDEIPVIKLDVQEFTTNLQSFMQEHMELGEADMSKALVALSPEFASIPIPKLKRVSRLRTEHQVYELPDSHPLLKGMDSREPDDPSPYLLAIWTPGETADSFQPPESTCRSQEGGCGGGGGLCNNKTCFSCNSSREAHAQTVRGTILVPCRTAMRGSFPLNGTYFQVNEVFADHESSLNPIDVPRRLLWNLPRRTVYFGSSVTSIFKGLTTEGIQYCFWKGFVCVRGFDQKSRAPRPLRARLHIPASKVAKRNE